MSAYTMPPAGLSTAQIALYVDAEHAPDLVDRLFCVHNLDGLDTEAALQLIDSQLTALERVTSAHVERLETEIATVRREATVKANGWRLARTKRRGMVTEADRQLRAKREAARREAAMRALEARDLERREAARRKSTADPMGAMLVVMLDGMVQIGKASPAYRTLALTERFDIFRINEDIASGASLK